MGEILPLSGVNVMISSWQRTSDNMIPSRAKINGSYINSSLMKNEAIQNGFDDAISLDNQGHIAEGTVANFFMIKNGQLITPDTSSDILEGITRATIMQVAADLHIPTVERSVDRSEVYTADEAMYVGSSARVTPILSIDHRPIGNAKPGPLTGRIADQYRDVVTGLAAHVWLTPVYERTSRG
jgi:branched-chain amino acid aminotransferase